MRRFSVSSHTCLFLIYSLFFTALFNLLYNRKTPETLRFRGILRLDTMYLAVLNIYLDRSANLDFASLHLGRAFALQILRPMPLCEQALTGHYSTNLHCSLLIKYYSMIVATRPDPTVRPPSRIAKVRPWLIAIGWISSIVISMLSPGMHISVPSGRLQTPVTSVVLK